MYHKASWKSYTWFMIQVTLHATLVELQQHRCASPTSPANYYDCSSKAQALQVLRASESILPGCRTLWWSPQRRFQHGAQVAALSWVTLDPFCKPCFDAFHHLLAFFESITQYVWPNSEPWKVGLQTPAALAFLDNYINDTIGQQALDDEDGSLSSKHILPCISLSACQSSLLFSCHKRNEKIRIITSQKQKTIYNDIFHFEVTKKTTLIF